MRTPKPYTDPKPYPVSVEGLSARERYDHEYRRIRRADSRCQSSPASRAFRAYARLPWTWRRSRPGLRADPIIARGRETIAREGTSPVRLAFLYLTSGNAEEARIARTYYLPSIRRSVESAREMRLRYDCSPLP